MPAPAVPSRPFPPAWSALTTLLRFPAVLGAFALTALVLGVAAASSPLFLSSARSAALADELGSFDALSGGVAVTVPGELDAGLFAAADAGVREAARAAAGLPEVLVALRGPHVTVGSGEGVRLPLFGRTGALEHVQVVRRDGAGVWLAASAATRLGVDVGDEVVLRYGDATASARVGGVYRDLAEYISTLYWRAADPLPADHPIAAYWAHLGNVIVTPTALGPVVNPPFLLAPPEEVVRLGQQLQATALHQWEMPYDPAGRTYEDIRQQVAGYRALERRLRDPLTPAGAALGDLSLYGGSADVAMPLQPVVGRVDSRVASLRAAVAPVALAAVALSLLVVGAAAAFGVGRRRTEMRLRAVQGVHPGRLGVRAAAEAVLPLAAGAAAGWALAVPLVAALGPSAVLSVAAETQALRRALVAGGAALTIVALVTALLTRALAVEASARAGRTAARVPWEAMLLAAAAAAYVELTLGQGGGPAGAAGEVDGVVLLFPFLFMAGAAGVIVRLLARGLPWLRRVTRQAPPPLFLAARRLALAPATARLLVTAGALSLGVLVYAASLAVSAERTVATKAAVAVGSDAAVDLDLRSPVPAGGALPVTVVTRGRGELVPGGQEADVLAVDPRTFADAAFFDPRFADVPLRTLLDALDRPGEALPVLLAGAGGPAPSALETGRALLPITVVGRPRVFPGMSSGRPLVVVGSDRLSGALAAGGASITTLLQRELWVRGQPEQLEAFLATSGLAAEDVRTVAALRRETALATMSWTFGYLSAVGAGAGVLALAGLLVYLAARQHSTEVAYVLARRMGLRRAAHRGALAVELAGLLTLAAVVGGGLALLGAGLVLPRLDPLPQVPPGPFLAVPARVLLLMALAATLTAVAGAVLVQRRADRARVTEVLRVAG